MDSSMNFEVGQSTPQLNSDHDNSLIDRYCQPNETSPSIEIGESYFLERIQHHLSLGNLTNNAHVLLQRWALQSSSNRTEKQKFLAQFYKEGFSYGGRRIRNKKIVDEKKETEDWNRDLQSSEIVIDQDKIYHSRRDDQDNKKIIKEEWDILKELLHSHILPKELDEIYKFVGTVKDAQQASVAYRVEHELVDKNSYIFGEVHVSSFWNILHHAQQILFPRQQRSSQGGGQRQYYYPPLGTFVDLGSASGRAVLIARLAFDFSNCIGIEYLPTLHEFANGALLHYQEKNAKKGIPFVYSEMEFIHGDFLQPIVTTYHSNSNTRGNQPENSFWCDASVVFAHSTCFEDDLLHSMNQQAAQHLPSKSLYIVCSLWNDGADLQDFFELKKTLHYPMTWGGDATIYIFEKQ